MKEKVFIGGRWQAEGGKREVESGRWKMIPLFTLHFPLTSQE